MSVRFITSDWPKLSNLVVSYITIVNPYFCEFSMVYHDLLEMPVRIVGVSISPGSKILLEDGMRSGSIRNTFVLSLSPSFSHNVCCKFGFTEAIRIRD